MQPSDRPSALRSAARRRNILIVGSIVALAAIFLYGGRRGESLTVLPTPVFDAAEVTCPGDCVDPPDTLPVLRTLESGETLDQLLEEVGFGAPDRLEIVAALSDHVEIRRLQPGLEVSGFFEKETPREFEVLVQRKGRVLLDHGDNGWQSRWSPFEETRVTREVAGVIDGSLVGALAEQGAPVDVAYRMSDVLRWDVDFNRDLRTGDRFEIVYEEVFLDGVRDRTGDVVALAFWNRGRLLEAYRYDEGYYDADGRPLQKMFLRSPLPFTRVTSRFSNRRFHPVLKTYRPHYGVDYGAPTGTPVRATANGVVVSAAWGNGSGRMVKVRHPNNYLTAYLHLSKYGSGMKAGRRVRQGDVVGYVGSSGLATAPHLDYRVQHHGKWIDPLSIKAIPADPIPGVDLPEFLAQRDALRLRLSGGSPWEEAGTDTPPEQFAAVDVVATGTGPGR
ncbi:MAG: peptidoglycan DD-metalloendopeptidase family protein [Thermoanaerobaculia bacterium]|nr:peptidoglycan DD-metalloendopeptidase family protein [Thermoanaerobaculia bacterium]